MDHAPRLWDIQEMNKAAATAALFLILLTPVAAAAAPEACQCKHLESLQQELENALYEAAFFASLAKRLDAVEKRQADINRNDPTNREAGVSPGSASKNAREAIMKAEFRLPHAAVKDYKGPKSVEIETGKCTNVLAELKALAEGASCKEIGDVVLKHEEEHRNLCNQMGAEKYWTRLPSLVAAEEGERYAAQARAMRALLKKAIDGGKLRLSEEMEVTTSGQGMRAVYFYETKPFDLAGASNPGADEWTLTGEGARTGVIRSAEFPGMQCTPFGQLNDRHSASLTLDGLKMSLKTETVSGPGDVGLKCRVPGAGQGVGMSMRPLGESGGGEIFKDQRVRFLTEVTTDVATLDFARMLAANGMAASGYEKAMVELVCPAK